MENVLKKVGAGYARVSTDEQSKNGLSIDVQVEMCKKAMIEDGYEVLDVFRDEGKSGGTLNRAGIKEIIRLVEEEKINAVYTIHSDRIARNTLDYLNFRKLCRDKNVILKCIYQPMTDDSATSRTMDTVVASFNEMQRLVTSEKVKATLYEKARQGYFPATPPPGYKNVENPNKDAEKIAKKIVVKKEGEWQVVKEIFRLFGTGNFNGYDLCDIAWEKGLKSQRGGKVSPSRMYYLLKNRFYLGEVHWGPIHNKNGKHEAIIDEALFNQVQQILDTHNNHACRRRKYDWLLNGFLFCFRHARRYTAEWHKIDGKKKRIAYYHCPHKNGCGKYSEQVEMEEKVADKFKDLEFAPEFVNSIIEKAKAVFYERRKDYDRNRQRLINQRTGLDAQRKSAEDKLIKGILSDEAFTRNNTEISNELKQIDDRLVELEIGRGGNVDIAQEILGFTRNIYKAYQKASPNLKRHYLAFFWKKFEVSDEVIIKSHPTLLFEELQKLEQVYYKHQENTDDKRAIVSNEVILMITKLRGLDSNQRPIA
jgi:site-specific DNA recombinase